jgi:drug/metabolite transporter (DMT)-like permease
MKDRVVAPKAKQSLPATDTARSNRAGIVAMLRAMAAFSVSDTCVKLATVQLPTSEIMVLRGVIATALVSALIIFNGQIRALEGLLRPVVALRAGAEALIVTLFISAVAQLALGNITAISQSSPLIMAAIAAIVLKESVGGRCWSAILAGFIGVLLIVRPTLTGVDQASLMGLTVALLVAARDLMTRKIASTVPSLVIAFATTVTAVLVGAAWSILQPWLPPSPATLALLTIGAIAVSLGNYWVILAFRTADVSIVSPFRYAIVAFALASGFLVFGDRPDPLAWSGITLIIGSGFYTYHRERLRGGSSIDPGCRAPTCVASRPD